MAASEDGTVKSDDELRAVYTGAPDWTIGERSSHIWFVLQELLGLSGVKNYDGSWTEYGSLVGVPIELGSKGLSSCVGQRNRPSKCRRAGI